MSGNVADTFRLSTIAARCSPQLNATAASGVPLPAWVASYSLKRKRKPPHNSSQLTDASSGSRKQLHASSMGAHEAMNIATPTRRKSQVICVLHPVSSRPALAAQS